MRVYTGFVRYFGVALSTFCLAGALHAQPAGYSAPWDVKQLMDSLVKEAQRLKPIVLQANPRQWKDASFAASYQTQWTSAQNLIQYFIGSADNLAKQPEKLPLALETYFRMEAMETNLASLADGIRRHDNPAVADLLQGVMNENASNREKLKQYLTDLAAAREQEFQIADREAQRCRGAINSKHQE